MAGPMDPVHHQRTLIGTNSRLDTLQAVLLSGKLAFLDAWTQQQFALAARYSELVLAAQDCGSPVLRRRRATFITCSWCISRRTREDPRATR